MTKLFTLLKKTLLVSIFALAALPVSATHYMGGDLTYEFLGIFGGQYRYRFQLDVYINRLPPSNFPSGDVDFLDLCIYDAQSNALVTSRTMTNPTRVDAFPTLPPGCSVPTLTQNLSARLNRFTEVIDLPGPFSDHYAIHERCCRDNNINNLLSPGSTGNTFPTEMAPNFVQNSSPQFQDIAIPFLCTGDTTTFSNNAIDPDGDFLVYNFVRPYDQLTGGVAPACAPTYDVNNIPIVPYANSNFTLQQPFGPGSYAFINASNGLTQYYAPNPGKYTLAIEIQEYRDIDNDGIQDLIGRTYRELFFIAQPCAANPTPAPTPVNVNGAPVAIINNTADIDINEGESLTFDFGIVDSNNDSVYIEPVADIIDGTNGYTGPLATFPDTVGSGSATSTFTWQTTCGITGQYLVRVNVRDNGCPPKDDIYFFNINVRPFEAASSIQIADPSLIVDSICFTPDTVQYVVQTSGSNSITWSANGGNIIGQNNQDTVNILWTSPGQNQIELIETNSLACTDTVSFDVNIIPLDTIQATADLSLCEGDSIQLTAIGTTAYDWNPKVSIIDPNTSSPIVFPTDTIAYIVSNPTPNSCVLVDTVIINVVENFANAGTNAFLCTGDTTQLGIPAQSNKIYQWSSGLNITDSTIADPQYLTPVVTTPLFDTLTLTVQDTVTGCLFTNEVAIVVNPLPTANAGLADTICSNESTNIGFLNTDPDVSCTWTGNFVGNPNSCQTFVTPINQGSSNLTYQYIVDVVNTNTTCVNSDTIEVISKPLPFVFAGLDTTICRLQSVDLGSGSTPGYVYSWVSNGSNSPISPTNSSDPQQFLNDVGFVQTIVTVINTDPNNLCTNRDTVDITVNDLPVVTIIPDTVICSEEAINIGGLGPNPALIYSWNTTFGISDSTVSNPVLFIDNPTQASQFFDYTKVVTDTVTGCIDSADVNVEIKPLPIVDAGVDIAICSESTDTIGTPLNPAYGSYTWNTSVNLDDSTKARPEVALLTGSNPDSVLFDLVIEWNGCFDRDTVQVRVNPKPVVDTIFGGISICPDLQSVDYFILDTIGFASFQWGVVGGVIITPTNNDSIQVDWGGLNPNASIFMIPTNDFGCVGDTITVPVDINPIISSPPPVGPSSICLSDANTVIYSVPLTTGYNYTWSNPAINHTQIPISPGNQAAYTFLEPGIARIFVEQNVTTPTSTCLGFSDTLEVVIHPDPDLNIPIVGDTSICEGTTGLVYSINGFPNSSYQWSVFPGGSVGDTTNTVTVDWDSAGDYQVVAFETTEFGCTSGDVLLEVQINPIPETGISSLDTFVCAETAGGNTYNAVGFNNSRYVWDVIGGSFESNDSSETAVVTWVPTSPLLEINVVEISEFNCVGLPTAFSPDIDLSLPLVANVSLTDPQDTFSNVEIFYNKGNLNIELVPDSLTVYRKRATEATWTPIGRVSSSDSAFIDTEDLNRVINFYEYQVSSINSCANEIFSPQHNTILLEGEGIENLDQLNLFWNEYVNWENGVLDYEIYRRLDDEEDFTLYQATGAPAYTDFSANDGFEHYFRIRAVEAVTGFQSWSNEFFVEYENIARAADVITPNGDGKNDTWKIDNIELYPGTKVTIYNRWGFEVYSTDNYQGDWAAEDLSGGTYFFQAVFKHLDEPIRGYIEVLK